MLNILLNYIRLDKINKKLLEILLSFFRIKIVYFSQKYDNNFGESILNAVLLLPAKGCSWSKEKKGGCSMCGFNNAFASLGIDRFFSDAELFRILELGMSFIENKHPKALNIYNAGSFLNKNELSFDVQKAVVEAAKKNYTIETLLVESRPEFISFKHLSELVDNFNPKIFKIGIGLESANDYIRNVHVNKGISKKVYEESINITKQLGVKTLTYILIKPINVSESDAIEEAIDTAKYAFSVGSDEVSFEAACIHKATKMEELYMQNKYKPPWLWSIIEVIKASHELGKIQIGSFWDFPTPVAKPKNCYYCSSRIEKLLDRYRVDHNIQILYNENCKCRNIWREETRGKYA